MRALHILGGLGVLTIAAWGAACGVHLTGDCTDNLDCAGDDDGGPDANGEGGRVDGSADGASEAGDSGDASHDGATDGPIDGQTDTTPPCDPAKGPATNPCVVSDATGVFVAPAANGGSDTTGNGSKAKPYETLGKGLTAAIAASKVLLVCNATYDERVKIDPVAVPVRVYGGLACPPAAGAGDAGDAGDAGVAAWAYVSGARAIVSPTQLPTPLLSVPTLTIGAVTKSVDIVDVEFDALDAAQPGESSFAAWVAGAKGAVTFTRVKLVAGSARNGATGITGTNYDVNLKSFDPLVVGNDYNATFGGAQQNCASLCTNGATSTGGQGGNGTLSPSKGNDGAPIVAGAVAPIDGAGGAAQTAVAACVAGHTGSTPPNAGDGAGASQYGSLTDTAWTASAASAGALGTTAQGGGGGGGTINATKGGGGGGGCGGCGGAGGASGTSGGTSAALVIVSATSVTMNSSEMSAATAGNGGNGSPGQAGQVGGLPGAGACSGGNGGTGGGGGAGGGGAGGVSVGILFHGTGPVLDASTTAKITLGAAGTAGVGGNPGTNDGKAGVAQAQLAIP